MKSEPLRIKDGKFLINRLIQQAPKGTLVREFFKNADENAALAAEGNRKIDIYPVIIDGIRKIAFFNTGVGMDDKELKLATEISSSINKEMSLEENFGIGAKVSGLTVSPAGIRYRSCKNGTVNEVIIGFDAEIDTYARFSSQLDDGTYETVYEVTAAAEQDGHDLSFDWTEVVLFGETEDHDTVSEPLGVGVKVKRSYIATTIFRRFAEFKSGAVVRIDTAMTKGGGKNDTDKNRQLRTLEDVLPKLPKSGRIICPAEEITVHYVHDPKHQNYSHTLSSLANPATASTTFCAVVHKGERYDFKTGKAWSSASPNFGIPFGSKVLTIEIEIPDKMALPNQYRDGLTWPDDRSQLLAEDFADYVRELMPDWVKDVIREQSPSSEDNLDDLQTDLQKLLDEFRVPTVTLSPTRKPLSEATENSDEGSNTSTSTELEVEFGNSDDCDWEKEGDNNTSKSQRSKHKKVRKAPDGAKASRSAKALERVPEIKILTTPEEITEKNLKGRAGRYYKEPQTLFINGLYSASNRMALELEPTLRGTGEPEIVRAAILKASQRFMAYRVGKATCYAISKRLSDDWTGDDLDRATSPESLTMAADDYKQSLNAARKWAKKYIKQESLPDEAAA